MLRNATLAGVAGVVLSVAAWGQTVEEIVAQNLEAKGGEERIKSIQSARLTGHMTMGQGMEAPFVLEWKRPNRVRLEFTMQGMTGVQAYDGTTGWMVMPFMGKEDPEEMSEEDRAQIEEMADFDGELVDWKEKGHQVELLGKETVEGTEAYKLKVAKKSGAITYIYLDADAFLEFKHEGERTIRGQEVEFESSIGDYKEVGGVLFAHSIENKPKGAPAGQVITVETIELDVEMPDERFAMPEPAAGAAAGEGERRGSEKEEAAKEAEEKEEGEKPPVR